MDGTFIDCLPDSPFRSPAWRWLGASRLHRTRRRSRPRVDDGWMDCARRFLARQNQHASRPAAVDSAILGAHALSCEPDPHRRWRLEALLLTSEPLESVARRCALPPDVVEAYHALFFACRDRPEARDWVTVMAVECGPWNNFAGPQPVGLWKYAAFSGGPVVLDVVIAVTTGLPMPDSIRAACARNPDNGEAELKMGVKLTTALMTSRSPVEVESLIAIHDDLVRSPGQRGKRQRKATPIMRLMESVLESQGRRRPTREVSTSSTRSQEPCRTPTAVAVHRQQTLAGSGSLI